MIKMKNYLLPLSFLMALVIALQLSSLRGHGLNEFNKLYICQTERFLDIISRWETEMPGKYDRVTESGELAPFEAARIQARRYILDDLIVCDKNLEVVLREKEAKSGTVTTNILSETALTRYCPRTIKEYGHPCR
jgi:hypothetical protein